ncbi:DUF6930 domain-containing protein [Anthocerotibacter panamensis]|uniref:DUF6930 domain-containing protein n=1 Tax=Anthocerotibacter panamensis TaxID=2857077 RepID=UPI001C402BA2|nr:hypothetical protein [Anthocerotibacter panamensis]
MLTDIQAQAIQRLPRTTHVWQGDLRALDSLASVRGIDGGLTGVFWIDEATAAPRSVHPCVVTHDHQKPPLILEGLIEALLSPIQGNPVRPRQLVVCRREYQFYLRGVLQNFDIQVEYRPQLPLMDEVLVFLAEQMGGGRRFLPRIPDDLPEDQVLRPQDYARLRDLYQQTVALWRRAPWNYLAERPPLVITLNQWGIKTLQASILGATELQVGVVFYYNRADCDNRTPHDDGIGLRSYDALYLHFQPEEEVSLSLVELYQTHHWPQPNQNTFVEVGRVVKGQGLRPLGRTEVLIVQTALSALNLFLSKQGRRLREQPNQKTTYTCSVPHPQDGGKLPIWVEYEPLPVAPLELVPWSGLVRDDLFPEGMSVLYEVIPWSTVSMLEVVAGVSRPAPRDVPMGTLGFPVVMLALKTRAAQKVCQRLLDENFLGVVFAQQIEGGEVVDFTMVTTQRGGGYLVLDMEHEREHRAELQKFQQAQRLCQGGHGLVIIKDRRGSSFDPEDVVGIFTCNGVTDLDLQLLQESFPE